MLELCADGAHRQVLSLAPGLRRPRRQAPRRGRRPRPLARGHRGPGRARPRRRQGRRALRDRDRQQRRRRGLVPALGRGAVPGRARRAPARALEAWGGNSSGVGVANIDHQGRVHPDTYWSDYTAGSVKERPFSAIWTGDDPMLAALRQRPRPLKGRCGACAYKAVCGGNTRIRALQLTGDPWAEDPACFLDDAEIGVARPRAWRSPRSAARAMIRRIASLSLAALLAGPALAGPVELFATYCASCHGSDRLGAIGPALIPETLGRHAPTWRERHRRRPPRDADARLRRHARPRRDRRARRVAHDAARGGAAMGRAARSPPRARSIPTTAPPRRRCSTPTR